MDTNAHTYKYEGPHAWLVEKIRDGDEDFVRGVLSSLLREVEAETIEDVFASEMRGDGYFDPLCSRCGEPKPEEELADVGDELDVCRDCREESEPLLCQVCHGEGAEIVSGSQICAECQAEYGDA